MPLLMSQRWGQRHGGGKFWAAKRGKHDTRRGKKGARRLGLKQHRPLRLTHDINGTQIERPLVRKHMMRECVGEHEAQPKNTPPPLPCQGNGGGAHTTYEAFFPYSFRRSPKFSTDTP